MNIEVWKKIPRHPFYEVSDQGRVRSLDRVIRCQHQSGGFYARAMKGKVLSPIEGGGGYFKVLLGRGERAYIHCLVALVFIGPKPKGAIVDHENRRHTDNKKSNIRYITRAGNMYNSGIAKGFYQEKDGRWRAHIMKNNRFIGLGRFNNPKDAARAREVARVAYLAKEVACVRTLH